jgi:hypothetical protein
MNDPLIFAWASMLRHCNIVLQCRKSCNVVTVAKLTQRYFRKLPDTGTKRREIALVMSFCYGGSYAIY